MAVLGLWCDIFALPVREKTGLPYASENDGVMHACGHDFHAACMLGDIASAIAMKKHAGFQKGISDQTEMQKTCCIGYFSRSLCMLLVRIRLHTAGIIFKIGRLRFRLINQLLQRNRLQIVMNHFF